MEGPDDQAWWNSLRRCQAGGGDALYFGDVPGVAAVVDHNFPVLFLLAVTGRNFSI